MSIQNPCDYEHCPNAATLHVRVPTVGLDSYTIDCCDEHWHHARAVGATVEEWLDRPAFLPKKDRAA